MKQLFFLLFSFFHVISAQSIPAEKAISDKLKKLESTHDIHPKEAENLLFKLKAESEKLGYDQGILRTGGLLMKLYLSQDRNREVIKLAEGLKKITKDKKDTYGYISNIYRKNALALGYLGLNNASIKDLKKAINYAQDIKEKDRRLYFLSLCYQDLGLHYGLQQFENKNLRDSLLFTYNNSIALAKQIRDNSTTISKDLKYDQIAFTYMRLGIFYLEESNVKESLELAESYLLSAFKIYHDERYNLPPDNKIMTLNQVSWLYMEKKEYHKSIDYANQALEMEKHYRVPTHRVESFEFLANAYLELGEKEKSKFYMNEYTFLKDSIALVDKTNADNTMKKIASEVKVEEKEKSKKQLIIIGAFIFIAALMTAVLWQRNNKKLSRRYELMIEKLRDQSAVKEKQTNTTKRADISTETEERIIGQLNAFENSDEFLRKDITIGLLASQWNTNSKYLSEVIKHQKSQNFSSYINQLKIDYIVHKLYNEPQYRKYKISHLAEICGYASPQAFFTTFKKINGVTPAYFIQKLNENNI